MKRIRIAVGSNDGERINLGHLGTAKDFYIFDIFRNGSSSFVEKRRNTSPPETVKHGDLGKMRAVLQTCSGCDVIIGRRLSPNFIRVSKNTKFQPIVIE
jgi:predicted Fe-Mo cluster-binding NifX family protein